MAHGGYIQPGKRASQGRLSGTFRDSANNIWLLLSAEILAQVF